ncbi:MAG: ACT domain-containing protein [Balneolaceae bacterium]|nr:ACT domain-containing protein [Balneolaceae bacterium]
MLAAVSGALAEQGINIASLSLGRTQKGSKAITAVAVDKPLTDSELEKIIKLDGVEGLHYVSLTS